MKKINLNTMPSREIIPGYKGRFVHSENITSAYWDVDLGAMIPEHSHSNEQILSVIEGEFLLTVNGNSHTLPAGTVFVIPSNVKHAGKALTKCKLIDIFHPVREDLR